MANLGDEHQACRFHTGKWWLGRRTQKDGSIMRPHEVVAKMDRPPRTLNEDILNRVQGSMIGMAIGDALGAFVEFRPRQFLISNPVADLQGGGTWGLTKGQFTDDTSMALCLANSLIGRRDFVPYDQLVRYKWWYKDGYMSSTGKCFDIGAATKKSLEEFETRQNGFAMKYHIPVEQMDRLSDPTCLKKFNVYCSQEGVAGNGALMRLAPVPLFFWRYPCEAIAFSGFSGVISHGDRIAFDACRYYGALIVAAVLGRSKEELLSKSFYQDNKQWFNNIPIHPVIMKIAEGSYKADGGYADGIRGRGYVASALEAALWAFWKEDSFEKGALAAVNLGDDTDTTAAIYGQLAGACYGYNRLPKKWVNYLYGKEFIERVSEWLVYEADEWQPGHITHPVVPSLRPSSQAKAGDSLSSKQKEPSNGSPNHSDPSRFTKEPSAKPKSPSGTSRTSAASPTDTWARKSKNDSSDATSAEVDSERHSSHRWYSMYSTSLSDSGQCVRSYDDVYSWMLSVNKGYREYANALKADGVDGFWLINFIDDQNLSEKYGVKDPQHRRDILARIEKLKASSSSKP